MFELDINKIKEQSMQFVDTAYKAAMDIADKEALTQGDQGLNWKNEDKLFISIMQNYYLPEVLNIKGDTTVVRKQGKDNNTMNYFEVTYTDENGVTQHKYYNFLMDDKDAKGDQKDQDNIVIFEKRLEEIDWEKEQETNPDQYVKENGDTISVSEVEKGLEDGTIIAVDGKKVIKNDGTESIIISDNNQKTENGEVDTDVNEATEKDSWKLDENGNLIKTVTADVTTITYTDAKFTSSEQYQTVAERDAAAAEKEKELENANNGKEATVTGTEKTDYTYTGNGTYIPTFTKTVNVKDEEVEWKHTDKKTDYGVRTEEEAVAMIDPRNLDTLLHPQFDAKALKAATPMGKGLGASPGAACGKIVFTADDAVEWAERGEKVILVRLETSPEDITGMKSAEGILTVRGGMTSHAAVVARGMGECCVSGCGDIAMDEANKKFTLAGKEFHEGDFLSIDGTTGNIYDGIIPTVDATIAGEFGRIMAWADKYRTMKVRTNADTPADAKKAVELGAEGIGLCRTEHMFFGEGRIDAFREMICSTTAEEREAALAKVLPYQQEDFEGLFEALEGNPVTIRFLDPPLHEFVPTEEEDIKKLADAQGKTVEEIKTIIASLHEFNPMMGHRGCRLAVTYPEIAKMQTTAVIRAAINVKKAHADWNICPEIMIPLVGDIKELKYVKKFVVETADAEIAAAGVDLKYEVGTMIEIPRAALTADQIASEADFFCFGTNDLTQMTYGFSRDDAGKFLNAYYDAKIFENDPFAKLDQVGVGKLMKMAIELGKPVNPNLHVGICGEHGGDPSSVEFCDSIGLDYVSCSPFRVPIARLAAAQAAIAKVGK